MPQPKHPDPAEQPQIGDKVIYLPEGIATTVQGYEWEFNPDPSNINHAPKLKRYVLGCGVTVTRDHILQEGEAPPVEEIPEEELPERQAQATKGKAKASDPFAKAPA